MPYEIKKTNQCPASNPFGVFNQITGDLRSRCHPSRARALAQMRALYAAESGKMNSEACVLNLVKEFNDEWLEGNKKWVKVYPFSSWSHPIFSDTSIDEEIATSLKASFDSKVYGEQELVVSYDHGLDPAKGGKAAGWYEQLDVRDDGLWGLVRFTDVARSEIESGEWRYFSGEHYDEWENPHTGETHQLVFCGGAVTNRPYVKEGMIPLNFSEIFVERGEKVDEPANTDNVTEVTDEHADVEHSEPGTQGEPRTDERNDDDSADSGSRIDTPPEAEDTVDENQLRELLGVGPDVAIQDAITQLIAEVTPLREAAKAHSEVKQFAEMFPAQAKELEDARKDRESRRAKQFAESFANIADKDGKTTGKGYPQVVLDKLEQLHKSFSENTATVSDVTEVLELAAQLGMVDYNEVGSSREDSSLATDNPAKAFAEKVQQIKRDDKLDDKAAITAAAEQFPELYEGYRNQVAGRR